MRKRATGRVQSDKRCKTSVGRIPARYYQRNHAGCLTKYTDQPRRLGSKFLVILAKLSIYILCTGEFFTLTKDSEDTYTKIITWNITIGRPKHSISSQLYQTQGPQQVPSTPVANTQEDLSILAWQSRHEYLNALCGCLAIPDVILPLPAGCNGVREK